MRTWDKCGDSTLDEADFASYECVIGLDLASHVDIAAKAKLYWKNIPREGGEAERHFWAFMTYYLPESAIENAKNSQYAGWELAGLLATTPGDETDYGRIADDLMADLAVVRAKEIAYDPWQAPPLMQSIQARPGWNRNIELVEMRPTVQNFSPAMKELEGAVAGGRFHHAKDPILTWMISNIVCHRDNKDNIYPRKEREENKIDGVLAVLMALGRAMVAGNSGSIYSTRGVRTFEW